MTVAVRDDDADILTDLCRVTGLGRLREAGAGHLAPAGVLDHAASASAPGCCARYPLRARKRRDFAIWARRSIAGRPPLHGVAGRRPLPRADRPPMPARFGLVRRYVKSPPPALDGPAADLVAYLGGFFTGEGCFGLSGLRPRAVVKLRRDDRGILELFAERFGIGTVRDHLPYGNPQPDGDVADLRRR